MVHVRCNGVARLLPQSLQLHWSHLVPWEVKGHLPVPVAPLHDGINQRCADSLGERTLMATSEILPIAQAATSVVRRSTDTACRVPP